MTDARTVTGLKLPDFYPPFTQDRLLRIFTKAPGATWRFDVDVSLDAAARMAEFAQLAGIRGTFYVRATGDEYNPFSRNSARCLARINNAGHRLGLHCDVNGRDVRGVIRNDRHLFTQAYSGLFRLELVSFHMPDPELLWRDYAGFVSAYAAEWKGRYLSDSRREFGPDKEALVSDEMQVCLHAEHWFA